MNWFPLNKANMLLREQLLEIYNLLSHKFFQWEWVLLDNRLLLVYISKALAETLHIDLSSIKIYIPISIGGKLGAFYPGYNFDSDFKYQYEELLKKGLHIDIYVRSEEVYRELRDNIVFVDNIPLSLDFEKEYSHKKIKNNLYELDSASVVNLISCDLENIQENYNFYMHEYLSYINILWLLKDKRFKYKDLLQSYFFYFELTKYKAAIKFYREVSRRWYKTLWEYLSWCVIDKKLIRYDKNISINSDRYVWKVHKVYNIETAKTLQKWDIMVAENTNPEFLQAFYNASCICVETRSELSHAAITCKELNIPLILGAVDIFLSCVDWQNIVIDTIKKEVYIK